MTRRPCASCLRVLTVVLTVAACVQQATCFKEHDFKKCTDSAFCQRMRGAPQPEYRVLEGSVQVSDGRLQATLHNVEAHKDFSLELRAYPDTLRIRVLEPGNPRYEVQDVLMPDLPAVPLERQGASREHTKLALGGHTVTLTYSPFKLEVPGVLVLNERSMFGIEHRRDKPDDPPAGEWEESFKSHKDSKPKGPQALSFDLTFAGFQHVYGLPEHAAPLSLPPTAGDGVTSEPYRLYNLDVFEYLPDSPFGLYGSIPFLAAHRARRTVGAFWLNAAEMYVDVSRAQADTRTQWFAESGALDVFLLLGPEPAHVTAQYARLTGPTALPPLFSLGYHQCRCGARASRPRYCALRLKNVWSTSGACAMRGASGQRDSCALSIDAHAVRNWARALVAAQAAAQSAVRARAVCAWRSQRSVPPLPVARRWNYKDEADVAAVNAGFDAHALPADVIWLDIEHTDGKRYMTWDGGKFPKPKARRPRACLPA
jgi:Galactose mutarotase-like/Glycosyl hydrolases family 31